MTSYLQDKAAMNIQPTTWIATWAKSFLLKPPTLNYTTQFLTVKLFSVKCWNLWHSWALFLFIKFNHITFSSITSYNYMTSTLLDLLNSDYLLLTFGWPWPILYLTFLTRITDCQSMADHLTRPPTERQSQFNLGDFMKRKDEVSSSAFKTTHSMHKQKNTAIKNIISKYRPKYKT